MNFAQPKGLVAHAKSLGADRVVHSAVKHFGRRMIASGCEFLGEAS